MRAGFLIAVAPLAFISVPALAGEEVRFAEAPAWVAPFDFDAAMAKKQEVVVFDRQLRLEDGVVSRYTDIAYDVRNTEVLARLGTVQFGWLPDKGDLTIHRLQILRDGKIIDLVAQGVRPEIIRRETELERRTVNGALTALFKIPGIKVGDVLRFSSTTTSRDQALAGSMQATEALTAEPTRLGFGRLRISWPESAHIAHATLGGAPQPTVTRAKGFETIEVMLPIAQPIEMPTDAPGRFQLTPAIMAGSFASWSDVAAVMAPHYRTDGAIVPGSPLAKEVARIRSATSVPLERVALALQSVQDEVNYLMNGMDGGNYLPQTPEETWTLRYGDCKAKTLLLLAMLRELGVDAEAVMVNATNGDAVSAWQPLPGAFDHVIVRAKVDGEDYWLDGTSAGARLDTLREVPNFVYALPIRADGAELVRMEQRWPTVPDRIMRITYDFTRGVDLPGLYEIDVETHGVLGAQMRARASESDPKIAIAYAQKYMEEVLDSVVYDAAFSYDPSTGTGRLKAKGILSDSFKIDQDAATFKIYTASTNWAFDPDRARAAWRNVPYKVGGPMTSAEEAVIILPEGGVGASVTGTGDLAPRTIAGTRFERSLSLDKGVVRVKDSSSFVPVEIPAADIPAEKAAMRALASADPEVKIASPRRYWELDDKEIAQRVASLREGADALVKLMPDESNYYMLRGALYTMARDYDAALSDIDRAIDIDGTALAYSTRAEILTDAGRYDEAVLAAETAYDLTGDLAHGTAYANALSVAGRPDEGLAVLDAIDVSGDDRSSLAQVFAEIAGPTGRVEEAWKMLEEVLKDRPGDELVLNSQCWFMGTWNYRVADGEQLCDKAVKAGGYSAAALDSRALLFHRLGREDDALDDLEAALRKQPEQAASLYLRGIIRLGKGQADGRKDIEHALRLSPDIAIRYQRYGISPKR
ncbi:DUF3857 domain-containing protein [Qipengyuania sp. RANM35]|uniref:DUF3857 domain-containing protein n=1 Tax=Qipengyuania sp. RANM35 TaxID=3068635 RepID=UPI0034DACED2